MPDLQEEYRQKSTSAKVAELKAKMGISPELPKTEPQPTQPKPLAVPTPDKEDGGFLNVVGEFIKELPAQAISGVGDAINNTLSGAKALGIKMGIPDVGVQLTKDGKFDPGIYTPAEAKAEGRTAEIVPVADEAKTAGASMLRSITEFTVGFLPIAGGLKGAGLAGSVIKDVARNGIGAGLTQAVVGDPDGQRLSTLLNQVPVLNEIIPDYLADTNPDNEGEWDKRIKNGLDSMLVVGATDGLLSATRRMFKLYKAGRMAKVAEPTEAKTAEQAIKETADGMAAKESAQSIVAPIENPVTARYVLKTGTKGDITINMDHVDALSEVKKVMQNTADAYVDPKTGAKTFAGIKEASKEEMVKVGDLLGRQVDRPFTAEEAVAAREIMTASAEKLTDLAKKATDPLTKSPQAQFEFRQALALHNDIQEVVLAGRKATAQSLASWRINAGAGDRAMQISQMLEGQSGNIDKAAQMLADLGSKGGSEAVSKAAHTLADPTKWDALYEVWVNGLLSGPATHAANIISNMGTTVMGIGEKYISTGFAAMRGEGRAALTEANAKTMGFFGGLRDSWKLLNQPETILKTGSKTELSTPAVSHKLIGASPDSVWGKGMDYIGSAINAPGWALEKSDNFFKGLNYRMQIHEGATRMALQEGLQGKELSARIAELITKPTDELMSEASQFAKYQTFTNTLGETGQKMQSMINSNALLKYVMPFVRTPVNIFKYGIERTPAGYLMQDVRAAIKAGGSAKDAALAKMSAGSLLLAGAASACLNGSISGNGPMNPSERATLMATGWQPYSIKVGDKWISYARLEPIGSLLGYGADMASIMGQCSDDDSDNLAIAGFAAFSKQLASKTFVSGAVKMMDAISSGEASTVERTMQDLVTSFAPFSAAGKTVHKYFDDTRRDYRPDDEMGWLRSTMEKYKENLGILTPDAPPLRDVWGEELHSNNGIAPMLENVSPIAIKGEKDDPVNKMMAERHVAISLPSRTMNGIKLTNKEYSEYCKEAGQWSKKMMDRLVSAGRFDNFTDELTQQMVMEVVEAGRKRAKASLLKGNLELTERIKTAQKDKYNKLRGIE